MLWINDSKWYAPSLLPYIYYYPIIISWFIHAVYWYLSWGIFELFLDTICHFQALSCALCIKLLLSTCSPPDRTSAGKLHRHKQRTLVTRGRGVATRAHGVVTRGRGLVLDRRRRESEERRDLTSMVQAGAGARQLGMAGVDYDTIYLSIGKICFH